MSLIGAAVIGGVAGLLGSGMNKKSVDSTNQQNMEIARMNNEYNERMMEKQMAYNTEMWNAQNSYNDPSAQVERLKNAGLNPYMMLNGGSSGQASSALGVNAPTAQAVTMQPFQGHGAVGDFIQRALDYELQRQEKKEVIQSMQQSRQMQFMETMSKVMNMNQDLLDKKTINEMNRVTLKGLEDRLNADYKQQQLNHQLTNKEIEIKTAEAAIQQFTAAKIPEKYAAELGILSAQYGLLVAQGKLAYNTARTEYFKQAELSARSFGIRLDNNLKKATFDVSVAEAKYNAYNSTAGGVWSIFGRAHQKVSNILGW